MYQVKLYNKIAKVGLKELPAERYQASEQVADYDAILVRSAALHDEVFPASLRAIARAGAGVNNIPIDRCTEEGVCVFNTPGANANAVKELAVCALLLASRKIVDGILWANTLSDDVPAAVEKGKSAFVGPEIAGKTLGVVGFGGAIGRKVTKAAVALGMKVVGYDPFLSDEAAKEFDENVCRADTLDELYPLCDYITYHIPSTPENRGIIGKANIAKMRDGVRILNLSRADLANTEELIPALESGKVAAYVTDFPTAAVLGKPGVIAIPHLGASTPESEDNCAVMAARELKDYLENGNVKNSVNLPNLSMERQGNARVAIIATEALDFDALLSNAGAKVLQSKQAQKKGVAYYLADLESAVELKFADSAIKRVICL